MTSLIRFDRAHQRCQRHGACLQADDRLIWQCLQKLVLITKLIRGYVKLLDELSLRLVDAIPRMESLLKNRSTSLDR